MSCRPWHEAIALLVGGDLTPAEEARTEEHLEACPACRERVERLREDRRALRSLAAEMPPPESLTRVRTRVLHEIGENPERIGSRSAKGDGRSGRLALAAALVAAALLLGLWTARLHREPVARPDEAPRVAREEAPIDPAESDDRSNRPDPPNGSGPPPSGTPPEATPETVPSPGSVRPPVERRTGEADRLAEAAPLAERSRPTDPTEPNPTQTDQATQSAPEESITIRIVSEDPDIVFYWLTDEPKEVPDEATV